MPYLLSFTFLWFNTFILILTSIVFVSSQIASKNKNFSKVKKIFFLIGGLSFVFLLGQLIVWQQLINLGHFVSTNPSNAYFYLFTTKKECQI